MDHQLQALRVYASNHGKDGDKIKSRGTRLSLKVLQKIFEWMEVGRTASALKAVDDKAPSSHGLYLTFPNYSAYGFVQRGKNMEGTRIELDVFPAETWPAWGEIPLESSSYAFCLPCRSSPTTHQDHWLLWDFHAGSIKLTEHIQPSCFVLIRGTESEDFPLGKEFFLVVRDENVGTMEVKWGTDRIDPKDLNLGIPLRTADISYVKETGQPSKVLFI